MRTRRRLLLSFSIPAALACGGAALARSPQTAATRAEAPDFVRDVQPILAASCVRCHGPAKQKGKLRLDTREGMLAGGEYGPVLAPGEPFESPVYKNLVEKDPIHRMPQEAGPLPVGEIETMRRWIEAGAPWPAGLVVADISAPIPPAPAARPRGPASLSFNRDVRPILAESCFSCHGPDRNRREAELRLDVEGVAKAALRSGAVPIVPGAPERSALVARVTDPDETRRMPLARSGKPRLAPAQVALLRRWIGEGAAWEPHWSYVPLARPDVPRVRAAAWPKNPVDSFVLARLEAEGMAPSPEAARGELLRRASFDLTGLPPTPEEVRAFEADSRPDAYERQVDRLLGSPRYGERMAAFWLDLVRYADSVGYHSDNARPMWRYRDWVVSAFNRNLPFDRFTAEQLAGDLLPEATFDERIASGYNRLLQTTEEGGAQPKEYRAIYLADRVRNASAVWMGGTMGCAQCHDHKFDPYSTRDFYAFEAFFADVKEEPVGRRAPDLLPDPAQQARLAVLDAAVEARRTELRDLSRQTPRAAWEEAIRAHRRVPFTTLEPVEATSANGTRVLIQGNDFSVIASTSHGPKPQTDTYTVRYKTELAGITALRLEAETFEELPEGGPGRGAHGEFVVSEMVVKDASGRALALRNPSASTPDGGGLSAAAAIDGRAEGPGWGLAASDGESHRLVVELAEPLAADGETALTLVLHQNAGARRTLGRFRLAATADAAPVGTEPGPEPDGSVLEALAVPESKRSAAQHKAVMDFFRRTAPELAGARARLREAELARAAFVATVPSAYVTTAAAPAPVRVLPRGNWQDDSGEVVAPAVPHFLPTLDTGGRVATRLDLARWLTARENPLSARVLANRLFRLAFGQGLSRTVEDLGAQGEWPTHPELLDWLAVELHDRGWDVKRLVRTLVTSATYRQSSRLDPHLVERDPANRLYARQSRFRLDAEMVRDSALAVAGLLSSRVGGESVHPYQPLGYWAYLNFPPREWDDSPGEDQYRRGLYTWWQRAFPQPSLVAFDAPSREECTGDRVRSNVPQQALVLLNDPTYVEAARVFAARIVREGGPGAPARLRYAYARALQRAPSEGERRVLEALLARAGAQYARDRAAALRLVATGQAEPARDLDPVELAAWTQVARAILNLPEILTRS
jgi:cytochrome c553